VSALVTDIVARIDGWGRSRPDRVAHVSGGRTLTYAELWTGSNAVATAVAALVPGDRSPIAVLGHKEPEMLLGFLGCVKAGHPYVPLDNAMPARRLEDIITASRASLTLTPEGIRGIVASAAGPPDQKLLLAPSDPFYIIFTSGSTGTPKGVPITLGCLTDFIDWMEEEQPFDDDDVFLNQVPYSFDVSVMDTFLGLVHGGRVFSINREHIANPSTLFPALAQSAVSIWVSTPAFVQLCLAERRFDQGMLPRLHRFFLAGEALAPSIVRQLFDRFPGAEVWNMYGPTEATVVTTSVRIDREMLERYQTMPIGFAKSRTTILVVDEAGIPVAAGERGEIVIAGPNVSPGYLNRPDATSRAFFDLNGVRAYRTGDIGHIQDGMLFFDGRSDDQIKLHGYRIELGDVETHLAGVADVRDVVVLPVMRNGRVDSLQAFVVLNERLQGSDFDLSNTLRARLADRLPAHMLPRRFRFLESFPMTVNGKVDRRKLAELD